MKKQSYVLLALAAALALSPIARADDTFDFSFTDGSVSGSGTLSSAPGNYEGSQIWLLTGGSGTFTDGTNSGTIALVGNPNYPFETTVVETDPSLNFAYDDQLSLFVGLAQYLTVAGLYFDFTGTFGSLDLNIYQSGGGPGNDGWYEGNNGNGDTNGTFSITSYDILPDELPPTPEPASYLLLGTGLLAMTGLVLQRRAAHGRA
jgi:hypothetical protein